VAVAGATQTKWTLSNNSTEGKKAMDSFSECGICRCPVENNLECPACLQATAQRTDRLTHPVQSARPVRSRLIPFGRPHAAAAAA